MPRLNSVSLHSFPPPSKQKESNGLERRGGTEGEREQEDQNEEDVTSIKKRKILTRRVYESDEQQDRKERKIIATSKTKIFHVKKDDGNQSDGDGDKDVEEETFRCFSFRRYPWMKYVRNACWFVLILVLFSSYLHVSALWKEWTSPSSTGDLMNSDTPAPTHFSYTSAILLHKDSSVQQFQVVLSDLRTIDQYNQVLQSLDKITCFRLLKWICKELNTGTLYVHNEIMFPTEIEIIERMMELENEVRKYHSSHRHDIQSKHQEIETTSHGAHVLHETHHHHPEYETIASLYQEYKNMRFQIMGYHYLPSCEVKNSASHEGDLNTSVLFEFKPGFVDTIKGASPPVHSHPHSS